MALPMLFMLLAVRVSKATPLAGTVASKKNEVAGRQRTDDADLIATWTKFLGTAPLRVNSMGQIMLDVRGKSLFKLLRAKTKRPKTTVLRAWFLEYQGKV